MVRLSHSQTQDGPVLPIADKGTARDNSRRLFHIFVLNRRLSSGGFQLVAGTTSGRRRH